MNGLPINGLPINGLPINGLNLSASPINGLPINGLPLYRARKRRRLPASRLSPHTSTTQGARLHRDQTLGEAAAAGGITSGRDDSRPPEDLLLADGSPVKTTLTVGDVIGLLIRSADVPWETLSPRLLSVFDTSRPLLHMSAGFTLQGIGQGNGTATVKVTLPAGFDFKPGSANLQIGNGGAGPSPTQPSTRRRTR